MLAPSVIPFQYQEWNRHHGAPFGRFLGKRRIQDYLAPWKSIEQLRGPFSIQPNNTTREFEFPWAFFTGKAKSGMHVLELGGGLSGFQFVLAQSGCRVVNVDPGMEANGIGWACDVTSVQRLNKLFGTNVELRNTTVDRADLRENSIDLAFSISVIEHLTERDIANGMTSVYRALKPGGLFVVTVDLFLNAHPFCSRRTTKFGGNQNVRRIVESENWEMLMGNPDELFGYNSFDTDVIISNLDKYLIGRYYPTMVQCLLLRKQGGS